MNNDEAFELLKNNLEGKTIKRIDPSNAEAGICKFVLDDDTVFRLHANDLGYWIEDCIHEDGQYKSLTALINDIYNENISLFNKSKNFVKINNNNDIYTFSTKSNKQYMIDFNCLKDFEKDIIKNKKKRLEEASELGQFWAAAFPEIR